MKKEPFKSYRYNEHVKITFNELGYIISAKGFSTILWSENPDTLDNSLTGKHITELSNMLKKYSARQQIYSDFVKHVLPDFRIQTTNSHNKPMILTKQL